jgi:ribosomal protein S27AE
LKLKEENNMSIEYKCSNCGETTIMCDPPARICPHCGDPTPWADHPDMKNFNLTVLKEE